MLHAELLALLRSELACPGDGNLDKRVDVEDLRDWQVFADICAQNQNQCSSVYDLNFYAVTDTAARVIINANLGRHCGMRRFLRYVTADFREADCHRVSLSPLVQPSQVHSRRIS